jgi:hypothetical protein
MKYKTPHQKRLELWIGFVDAMQREQEQLLSDLLISAGVIYLAAFHGANPTFAVGALTIINTITVTQVIKAFREIQAQNREDYTDET